MANADPPRLRDAGVDDRPRLVEILADAFDADPFFRWMFGPSEAAFRAGLRAWLALVTGFALPRGRAWLAEGDEGDEGAVVWLPPDAELVGPDELAAAGRLLGELVGYRAVEVLGAIAAGGSVVPDRPHWLCLYIGVRPGAQGRGLGRALLQPGLVAADASSVPAHLVATNPATAPFYEAFGFRALADLSSAPGVPALRPMWREPVPRAGRTGRLGTRPPHEGTA